MQTRSSTPDLGEHGPVGRLAPIPELFDAVRGGSPMLGKLLSETCPFLATPTDELARMRAFHGESLPAGLGAASAAVWHRDVLIVVAAEVAPSLRIDGGQPEPMTWVPGTALWITSAQVDPGVVHSYQVGTGGAWAPASDFAGYTAGSYELGGSRPGSVSEKRSLRSRIYPDASTDYWVYINPGIDERRGAPLMVWHDGELCLSPNDLLALRMQIVTDNLVHLGRIPPMVHVLVNPSSATNIPASNSRTAYASTMRGIQYDTFSDQYGRHIRDEVLPHVESLVKLRADAYSRGTAGVSSGGLCAFKLAWFHPSSFSRAQSAIGSFTAMQPGRVHGIPGGGDVSDAVRRGPKRNIRVWLSDGSNDLELRADEPGRDVFRAGSWPLNNIILANALKARGYDFHFRFGDGYHGLGQASLDLPESLSWLWRDYDPDRSQAEFQQDPAEREQPVYRVRIANRDAW